MGIPSYFAHVVRRHRRIIKRADPKRNPIDNLYMDCNSLIYDAVREIDPPGPGAKGVADFERRLIAEVCRRIEHYVRTIQPRCRLFIAFDGVAPVAKLDQQRNRRFKSWVQTRTLEILDGQKPVGWSSVAITPGTAFMKELDATVRRRMHGKKKVAGRPLEQVVVTGPTEAGEGEHKIYEYIRNNPEHHGSTSTVIYGMDADLFMLTLNHLHVAPRAFLYREMPDFIRSLDKSLDPNKGYLVDIPFFAEALATDLTGGKKCTRSERDAVISDYIVLCFMLGNDFMPHFPALNIRTEGIDRLMGAYTSVVASKSKRIVDNKRERLNWPVLRLLILELAKHEHDFILSEYARREKQSRRRPRPRPGQDPSKNRSEDALMNLPMQERGDELLIQPSQDGWERRYYQTLFDFEITDQRRHTVCMNYLEGLEWTYKYYTSGCVDWRWTYRYDYPPLLADLARYVPALHVPVLVPGPNAGRAVDALVQLSYVLPAPSLTLLPERLHSLLLLRHGDWYEPAGVFQWAFCKYFWEAHPVLNPIRITEIESIVRLYKADTTHAAPSLLACA